MSISNKAQYKTKTPRDMETGTVHKTSNSGLLIIVKYLTTKTVTVKFIGFDHEITVPAGRIRKGTVKNVMAPSVFGKGYIGLGVYSATKDKKAYRIWVRMLQRCYSVEYLSKYPTYKGCSVSKEWLNLQTFTSWFYKDSNYEDGLHLDKDLKLRGNKVYSAVSCLFISCKLNVFLACVYSSNKHGIGVYFDNTLGKLRARCNDTKGKCTNLGVFAVEDILLAQKAYIEFKHKIRDELVLVQTDKKVGYYLSNWVVPTTK